MILCLIGCAYRINILMSRWPLMERPQVWSGPSQRSSGWPGGVGSSHPLPVVSGYDKIVEKNSLEFSVPASCRREVIARMTIVRVLRSDRSIIVAAIGIISVLAWTYILWVAAQTSLMEVPAADSAGMAEMSMPGMAMSPGTRSDMGMAGVSAAAEPAFRPWGIADFAFVFIMWAVMMVGMMTPSVSPMVLLYANVGRSAASS